MGSATDNDFGQPLREIHHPLFARFFDRLSKLMERELAPERDELLAELSGRVIEIGAGNGINFAHYPDSVEQVVAIEPEPYLRSRAERAAATAPVSVIVRAGVADALEYPDASFDAAVTSLVLCSVPDQAAALAEIRRVLRAGGQLRFLEHVCSQSPAKVRVQRGVDRAGIWPRLAGGCHCCRDTLRAIRDAGFLLERTRSIDVGPSWLLTNPHMLGAATPERDVPSAPR